MTPSFVLFPFNHMIHSDNQNVTYLFSSPKILITKSRKIGEERRGEERYQLWWRGEVPAGCRWEILREGIPLDNQGIYGSMILNGS